MEGARLVDVHLDRHFKLSSEQCPSKEQEKEDMVFVSYSNVVGSMMYAMICIG